MNTTITIDKLILNLYYPLYEDLPRFLLQANNSISTDEMTDIRDFKKAFIISYRGQEIGFLNTGFHLNSTLNQIVIFNELFYTCTIVTPLFYYKSAAFRSNELSHATCHRFRQFLNRIFEGVTHHRRQGIFCHPAETHSLRPRATCVLLANAGRKVHLHNVILSYLSTKLRQQHQGEDLM